ncbi:MAG TPA: uracil-DNA glycosylase [Kofleriaceae bacterium]|nr:uracil-DNA glycosylase [Kofleriaceae bacterium]
MDSTGDAVEIGELRELTRQLRTQLRRYLSRGTWAASGGPTAAYVGAAAVAAELADAAVAAAATAAVDAASAADAAASAAGAASDADAASAAGAAAVERAMPSEAAAAAVEATVAAAVDVAVATAVGAVVALSSGASDGDAAAIAPAVIAPPVIAPAVIAPAAASSGAAVAERAFVRDLAADDVPHAADTSFDRFGPSSDDLFGNAPEPLAARAARDSSVAAEQSEILVPFGRRTLTQIREDLGECTRCQLHTTRRKIVFGVGAEDAPLMFVGEAPGEQEDKRGEPFVGPAGELLDKMIEAMGWTRQTVYVANTLKCRPPQNRNPQPDELAQCTPFLDAQIRSIAPRIIVTLGKPAANHVLHRDAPISALRGRFHDRAGVKVMPTFHPAYLLREPEKKKDTWSDLKQVIAELERLGIKPPRPPRA